MELESEWELGIWKWEMRHGRLLEGFGRSTVVDRPLRQVHPTYRETGGVAIPPLF